MGLSFHSAVLERGEKPWRVTTNLHLSPPQMCLSGEKSPSFVFSISELLCCRDVFDTVHIVQMLGWIKTRKPQIIAKEVVTQRIFHASTYLLQGIGLVTALVQAVSGVGGDEGASGVCVVNWADIGSGAVRGRCRDRAHKKKYKFVVCQEMGWICSVQVNTGKSVLPPQKNKTKKQSFLVKNRRVVHLL